MVRVGDQRPPCIPVDVSLFDQQPDELLLRYAELLCRLTEGFVPVRRRNRIVVGRLRCHFFNGSVRRTELRRALFQLAGCHNQCLRHQLVVVHAFLSGDVPARFADFGKDGIKDPYFEFLRFREFA